MAFLGKLYQAFREAGLSFKESRKATREEKAEMDAQSAFAAAFGASFDELFTRAAQRQLPLLLPHALPDILWRLATPPDREAVESGETLAAVIDAEHGAHWGAAPQGGEKNNSAFHATAAWDPEEDAYTVSMRPGTAQVVGKSLQNISAADVTAAGGPWTVRSGGLWCWLEWDSAATGNTPPWTLHAAAARPNPMGGDLNVPLWRFTYAADGEGDLLQLVEGGILLTWTVNALDVDDAPNASASS
jgi:hypothetical protein